LISFIIRAPRKRGGPHHAIKLPPARRFRLLDGNNRATAVLGGPSSRRNRPHLAWAVEARALRTDRRLLACPPLGITANLADPRLSRSRR
jgi:hypothetical protein